MDNQRQVVQVYAENGIFGAKVGAAIRARLAAGEGVKKIAKSIGVGNDTVSRVKAEMAA